MPEGVEGSFPDLVIAFLSCSTSLSSSRSFSTVGFSPEWYKAMASSLFIKGKNLPEVFNQGIEEYCLNRSRMKSLTIPFASTFGEANLGPVGSFVAGALKPFSIHEGLKEDDCVVIDSFPIPGDDSGHLTQNVRGKIGDFNPGQDKETGILDNEMDVFISVDRFPFDEVIPTGHLPSCCPPTDTGQRTSFMKDNVLEVFTHCLAVAKVMVSLNKALVERLPFGTSHHLDLNGKEFRKGRADGFLRMERKLDMPLLSCATPMSVFPRRKFHHPSTFKAQDEFTTSHSFEVAIRLPPVPETAKLLRDESSSPDFMFFNNRTDKNDVVIGNSSAPDDKRSIHEPLHNIVRKKTPVLF